MDGFLLQHSMDGFLVFFPGGVGAAQLTREDGVAGAPPIARLVVVPNMMAGVAAAAGAAQVSALERADLSTVQLSLFQRSLVGFKRG